MRSTVVVVVVFLVQTAATVAGEYDYGEALSKSLLYFEAQRSGRLPYDQRVKWRGHSGLTDGLEQGVDLVGGYYDAGDHVKFGLPMAFTMTMLSWGVMEYADHIADAGEYAHALRAIKWGTDYFIKAHTQANVLWAEVGEGETDHYCWQRSEDMTTSRKAYKVDEDNPGSDVVGETSAALAAASIVFRDVDPRYSRLLLHHSKQLFEFADKNRGKYDRSITAAKNYYASVSGYNDELLWSALWLHRATEDDYYLDYITKNAYNLGGASWAISEFSWDIKYAGVQVLAARLSMDQRRRRGESRDILNEYRKKAEFYMCSCLGKNNGTNVRLTPGGLLYVRRWNNMQYVSSASFLLTVYSDYLNAADKTDIACSDGIITVEQVSEFVKSQVNYILGSNPMGLSYLIGFGRDFPKRVHHRGASTVSYEKDKGFIGCTQGYDNWYGRQSDNPNVLVGAVVGGPDHNDKFRDIRGNFMQTEACTYNTAPLVGVFAKLRKQNQLHPIQMHANQ